MKGQLRTIEYSIYIFIIYKIVIGFTMHNVHIQYTVYIYIPPAYEYIDMKYKCIAT